MTPEQLFEATGDLYLRLIRPNVRDPKLDLALRELRKLRSAATADERSDHLAADSLDRFQ